MSNKSKHTPETWTASQSPQSANGANWEVWPDKPGQGRICTVMDGSKAEERAKLIAAAPELLAALEGCLAQLLGPAMVWGDGRGNDGKKTGLSGEEFNALLKSRLESARAAIAKATA